MSDPVLQILSTEFSEAFVTYMKNRMVVSFFKYGKLSDAYPARVNAIECLEGRLAKYKATGNTEWLIDASNFAMIEYMHPRHPDAHFEGTDSDASPGRVRTDGSVDALPNVPVDTAVEKLRERQARSGD